MATTKVSTTVSSTVGIHVWRAFCWDFMISKMAMRVGELLGVVIAMYPHLQYSLDPFTYRAIDYQVFLKLVSRHLEKQQLWKTRNIQIFFPNLKENTKNFGKQQKTLGKPQVTSLEIARRNQKKNKKKSAGETAVRLNQFTSKGL